MTLRRRSEARPRRPTTAALRPPVPLPPIVNCLIGQEPLPPADTREGWRRFVPICDTHLDEVRAHAGRPAWRALMQVVARLNNEDIDPSWLEETSLASTAEVGLMFNDERRAEFVSLLSQGHTVGAVCKIVGVSLATVLRHRRDNPTFAEDFNLAYELGTQVYEEELFRSGVKGRQKAVWYKGEKVGTERVYSDANLQFALKGRRPSVYREGQSTIVNLNQESATGNIDLSRLSDEELEQYERIIRKASAESEPIEG